MLVPDSFAMSAVIPANAAITKNGNVLQIRQLLMEFLFLLGHLKVYGRGSPGEDCLGQKFTLNTLSAALVRTKWLVWSWQVRFPDASARFAFWYHPMGVPQHAP